MKILIDIGHPAHVHFFLNPIHILQQQGHEILVTSRDKEMAIALLDTFSINHAPLSGMGQGGALSLLKELLVRDFRLYKVARQFRPDVMAGIGGIFISHAGLLTRTPSLVFYDTENATLQNMMTYPFASCVLVPGCYRAWLPRRHARYAGYHELSYLHPEYFTPDRKTAIENGLSENGKTWIVRTVSWQANHDISEKGWSSMLLHHVVDQLSRSGKVLISSESPLPDTLEKHAYKGDPTKVHHVMAFSSGFIGESATMASECAVLGTPAIYAANTGRGYTDEQESVYGLVKNIRRLTMDAMQEGLKWIQAINPTQVAQARQQLLDDTIDVARYVANRIQQPTSCAEAQNI